MNDDGEWVAPDITPEWVDYDFPDAADPEVVEIGEEEFDFREAEQPLDEP